MIRTMLLVANIARLRFPSRSRSLFRITSKMLATPQPPPMTRTKPSQGDHTATRAETRTRKSDAPTLIDRLRIKYARNSASVSALVVLELPGSVPSSIFIYGFIACRKALAAKIPPASKPANRPTIGHQECPVSEPSHTPSAKPAPIHTTKPAPTPVIRRRVTRPVSATAVFTPLLRKIHSVDRYFDTSSAATQRSARTPH